MSNSVGYRTDVNPLSSKWRFKTEKEFIDEYGNEWRLAAGFNGRGCMDYLLGTTIELDDDALRVIKQKSDTYIVGYIENKGPCKKVYQQWQIRKRMLTDDTRRVKMKSIMRRSKERI